MTTYIIKTFGCKTNQYESQGIRAALQQLGWIEHDDPPVDVIILNTCGVTARAMATARSALRQSLRLNPAARVVVVGCAVDIDKSWIDEIATNFSQEIITIPGAHKHAVHQYLTSPDIVSQIPPDPFNYKPEQFSGRTRAFIKIQDGCDCFCSYCIVPYARGKPVSRERASILSDARRLYDNGHAEIVLTGINIGVWHDNASGLAGLLTDLSELTEVRRWRISSLEPVHVNRELLQVMADKHICRHLHLPLQHGDDTILQAMNRRYRQADFLTTVKMIRDYLGDDIALSTDIIIGYPGEDDDSFNRTYDLIQEIGFMRLHVFPFSPRPGTVAAAATSQVPELINLQRRDKLIALNHDLAKKYADKWQGKEVTVIAETESSPGIWQGFTEHYVSVRFKQPDTETPQGKFYNLTMGIDAYANLIENS